MSTIFLSIFCFLTGTMFGSNPTANIMPTNGLVYSPGFEESPRKNNFELYQELMKQALSDTSVKSSIVPYQDAGGNISNACFYTRPSVFALAQELKKKVVTEGVTHLHIVGVGCGAGTLVNCLAKLAEFDANYFKDSGIEENNAQRIIEAVNKGSLVLENPLIALHKTEPVARTSSVLNVSIALSLPFISAYFIPSMLAYKVILISLSALTYQVLQKSLESKLRIVITKTVLPWLTHNNFNSSHKTPLQSSSDLKCKLTCPILLSFDSKSKCFVSKFFADEDLQAFCRNLDSDKTKLFWSNEHKQDRYLISAFMKEQFDSGKLNEFEKQALSMNVLTVNQCWPEKKKN